MAARDSISSSLDLTAQLLTVLTANPTPNVTIEGETIDMTGYLAAIRETVPVLMRLKQDLGGPFMRITKMRT